MAVSLFSTILVACSCFAHASWNLLSKKSRPETVFFLASNLAGTLLMLSALLYYAQGLGNLPGVFWGLLLLTGLLEALYYHFLVEAYQKAGVAVIYALTHSLPIIFILLYMVGVGRRSDLGALCWGGCFLTIRGLTFLSGASFSHLRLKEAGQIFRNVLWISLCTDDCSLVNEQGVKLLKTNHVIFQGVNAALAYLAFSGVSTSFWLAGLGCWQRGGKLKTAILDCGRNALYAGSTVLGLWFGFMGHFYGAQCQLCCGISSTKYGGPHCQDNILKFFRAKLMFL